MQTAQRVATTLGYSDAHIRRLCITGKINAVKFGRQWMIDNEEVQRLRSMSRNGRGIAAIQVASIQEGGDHGKTETK